VHILVRQHIVRKSGEEASRRLGAQVQIVALVFLFAGPDDGFDALGVVLLTEDGCHDLNQVLSHDVRRRQVRKHD
jgi:hypothetical protein